MTRIFARTRSASAWALLLCSLLATSFTSAAQAPDLTISSRLVWTTMVALDHANRTGNYSVLRELGARDFQLQNTPDRLASIFEPLRANRIDVGRAILTEPAFYVPRNVTPDGVLRLRGGFEFRPRSLRFDLLYKYENGWRLYGISVVETAFSAPRT